MTTSILHFPKSFWRKYVRELNRLGLFAACQQGTEEQHIYGDIDRESQEKHFCYRYPNSASRVFKIMDSSCRDFDDILNEILHPCMSHSVSIIDFICGAGSSCLALVLSLCELRKGKIIPQLPLNINIIAFDISEHALSIYKSTIESSEKFFDEHSIRVNIYPFIGDAKNPVVGNTFFSQFSNIITQSDIIFFMSTSSSVQLNEPNTALSHIYERLSNETVTQIYIEPTSNTGKSRFSKILKWLNNFKVWRGEDKAAKDEDLSSGDISYQWQHEIQTNRKIINGNLKCRVIRWNNA